MLTVEDLRVSYDNIRALHGVGFRIEEPREPLLLVVVQHLDAHRRQQAQRQHCQHDDTTTQHCEVQPSRSGEQQRTEQARAGCIARAKS